MTPASLCGGPYLVGGIWSTSTIDFTHSFILTFQASFDHAVGIGADGICVDFGQNFTSTSLNGNSALFGYYNPEYGPANPQYTQSFGVEFDIFDNSYNPYLDDIPGTDHTAICANADPAVSTPGGGPIAISPTTTNVKDGAFHNYRIEWCASDTTLKVYFDNVLRLSSSYNYCSLFTVPTAIHWGFSGGTGLYCSNQLVQDVVLTTGGSGGSPYVKDTTACIATPLILYADTPGSFIWSNGDTTSSIAVTASGTYWVTSTSGCGAYTDTIHVNYNGPIPVELGNDTTVCAGTSLTLSPTVSAGDTLIWNTGSTDSSIVVTTSGTYWVHADDNGCTGGDTVTVNFAPLPLVNLGPDTSACVGGAVTLQSSDSYTGPSYLWSTGSTTADIITTTTGSYWLEVTVGNCMGADTVNVVFNPVPIINLGNDSILCAGTTLTLTDGEPEGAAYTWSTGSNATSIQVSTPGNYSLTVDVNGCTATGTITILGAAIPTVNLGPDTSLCDGDTYLITANDSTVVWSTGVTAPAITVSAPGIYIASLSGYCGTGTDSVDVTYHACNLWFPTAFTPNGDNLNDIAHVLGTLQYYKDFSLSIYNRFGQRVYYTEDIYDGWDGNFNGTKQDVGTYFYMIYYTLEGKTKMLKGDLTLIR